MTKDYVYLNRRPVLTVEHGGGGQLGNCYHGSKYRITSLTPLDREAIIGIRAAGFIGGGQEFYILGQEVEGKLVPVPQKLDWNQRRDIKPTGVEKVNCSVRDRQTGKILDEPPINPYSGDLYSPINASYYVYVTEDRVDSSD